MNKSAYAHIIEALAICDSRRLVVVMRNYHRAYGETTLHKLRAKAQHIFIVGNAQVGTHLVALNVFSTDYNHNFKSITQL